MTDISREAVEALAKKFASQLGDDIQEIYDHEALFRIGRATLLALRAEVDALQDRAYRLGYAICGGEDAAGLVDSIETEWFESTIAKERAYARDGREALEAKLAERVTVKPLVEAMEDLLGETRGVLPESADAFYDYKRGEFTEARILSALTTAPITPAQAAKVLLEAIPSPLFGELKQTLIGEFHVDYVSLDEAGNEVNCVIGIPWTEVKEIIRAALRAIAERGQ